MDPSSRGRSAYEFNAAPAGSLKSLIISDVRTRQEQEGRVVTLDMSQPSESNSSWDDQTEYWRVANQLSTSVKIKDPHFREHFDNIKNEFVVKKSSASCKLSDIKGIIFGGLSSRFWLYRKHIIYQDTEHEHGENHNQLINKEYKAPKPAARAPFFSWQCITLELENRSVDLVIKDEEDMMNFIKFLILKLDTINTIKNTAAKVRHALYREMRKIPEKKDIPRKDLKIECQYSILRKVYLKYLILRVRAKLSHQAFIRKMTVVELIATQCYKSYRKLSEARCIPRDHHHSRALHKKFDEAFDGDMNNMFQKIFELNIMV